MIRKVILGLMNVIAKAAILIVAIYIIIFGAKLAYNTGYDLLAKDGSSNTKIVDVVVEIPQGSSTATIADILEEKGLINNTYYFRILAKMSDFDDSFQYGTYTFNTGMTEEDMMQKLLTEGYKRETVTFTIPEGYTIDQIAKKLDAEGICESEDFLDAVYAANYGYKFMDQIPDRPLKLQGYVFPNTYEVYTDATAADILSTMLNQFDKVFKDEYYERAEELGLTVDEVITIASIIEKEIKVPEERKIASGVIYNRLEIGMKLEMCSTVMYVLDKRRDRLLYSDLEIDSPYNTYMYPGLPIGPIANPGEAAIIAALYPEDHDYFYFVLVDEENGIHEFNSTLAEHNAAMKKYNQDF